MIEFNNRYVVTKSDNANFKVNDTFVVINDDVYINIIINNSISMNFNSLVELENYLIETIFIFEIDSKIRNIEQLKSEIILYENELKTLKNKK